jgi:hypothetical protein
VAATGNPRNPSFAPSSSITTAGLCTLNARGKRCNPPLDVSPLTLAFVTL